MKKVNKPGVKKSGNKTVYTSKSGVQYTKEVIPGKKVGDSDIGAGIKIPIYDKPTIKNSQKRVAVATKDKQFIGGTTTRVVDTKGNTTTKYSPGSGRTPRVKVTDAKGNLLYYKDEKGVRFAKSSGTQKPKVVEKITKTQEEMAKMNAGSSTAQKTSKTKTDIKQKQTIKKPQGSVVPGVTVSGSKPNSNESAFNNTKRAELSMDKKDNTPNMARKAMPTISESKTSTPSKAKVKELKSEIRATKKANRQEARTDRKVNRLEKKLERVKGTKMMKGGIKKPAVKMYKKGGKK